MKGQLKRNKHKRNKHHLIPKSRGGEKTQSNILLIDVERHNAWHRLWGNRTLDEVIALLIRVKHAKEHQRFSAHL